ncbi:MAG: hypothetical protein AAFV95_28660 [Bacteroidota bacterium]
MKHQNFLNKLFDLINFKRPTMDGPNLGTDDAANELWRNAAEGAKKAMTEWQLSEQQLDGYLSQHQKATAALLNKSMPAPPKTQTLSYGYAALLVVLTGIAVFFLTNNNYKHQQELASQVKELNDVRREYQRQDAIIAKLSHQVDSVQQLLTVSETENRLLEAKGQIQTKSHIKVQSQLHQRLQQKEQLIDKQIAEITSLKETRKTEIADLTEELSSRIKTQQQRLISQQRTLDKQSTTIMYQKEELTALRNERKDEPKESPRMMAGNYFIESNGKQDTTVFTPDDRQAFDKLTKSRNRSGFFGGLFNFQRVDRGVKRKILGAKKNTLVFEYQVQKEGSIVHFKNPEFVLRTLEKGKYGFLINMISLGHSTGYKDDEGIYRWVSKQEPVEIKIGDYRYQFDLLKNGKLKILEYYTVVSTLKTSD